MIKRIVYQKPITVSGQKVQLEIRLPMNVKRLLGLKLSVRYASGFRSNPFGTEVGWLWLRDAAEMDVFYSDRLIVGGDNYHLASPLLVGRLRQSQQPNFQRGSFSFHGKTIEHFNFIKRLSSPLIEGYYVDRLQSKNPNYTLSIYLKLEI